MFLIQNGECGQVGVFWYFFHVKTPWMWQDIRKPHGFQRVHKGQGLAWYLWHLPASQSLWECHPQPLGTGQGQLLPLPGSQGRQEHSLLCWVPSLCSIWRYKNNNQKMHYFSVVTVSKSEIMLILPLWVVYFSPYYFLTDNLNQMFQFWCN